MRPLFIDFTLPQLLRDAKAPIGGWAVQLRVLLRALSEAGHKAGVLTWKGANAYVGPQSLCDLVETYDPNKGIRGLRRFYSFIPAMLAGARAYKPDVIVQSCASFDTGVMAAIAHHLGVPFVHRIASNIDADGRCKSYLSRVEQLGFRYGLRRADMVLCQNGYQREQLERAYPGKRFHLLKSAIYIPPVSPSADAASARDYVAWVGVFRREKNLALLDRIARELPSVQFRVAGALPNNGRTDIEVAEAVDALSRRPNVTMIGYIRQSEIFGLLSGARALLSTSHFEGFSNTFLEAFACGAPVVTHAAIDPDGIIAGNGLGLISQDMEGLPALVRDISQMDRTRFDDISRRCRDYVETHHSGERVAEKLVTAFEPLIGSRSAPQ